MHLPLILLQSSLNGNFTWAAVNYTLRYLYKFEKLLMLTWLNRFFNEVLQSIYRALRLFIKQNFKWMINYELDSYRFEFEFLFLFWAFNFEQKIKTHWKLWVLYEFIFTKWITQHFIKALIIQFRLPL